MGHVEDILRVEEGPNKEKDLFTQKKGCHRRRSVKNGGHASDSEMGLRSFGNPADRENGDLNSERFLLLSTFVVPPLEREF